MALIKEILEQDIKLAFKDTWQSLNNKASQKGYESTDPSEVIEEMASELAGRLSSAIDKYIKSGDIMIGPDNITVTSPTGPCVVAPTSPAKVK